MICPDCGGEWNSLAPEGPCISCFDKRVSDERKQYSLGAYLKRVIGDYGIERYTFAGFNVRPENQLAFHSCITFDHLKDNLFIYGPCGTGKTHLAGAVLKEQCAKNLHVKWVNPMYLTRKIRSHFPSEEEGIIDELVNADVLIVDDLGTGSDLAIALRSIYEITDKRRAQKKNGLIVTSNLSLDDVAKAYKDDRILSRLAGMCRVLRIEGQDARMQGK